MKNKVMRRSIGTMVVASLFINVLSTNLFAQGPQNRNSVTIIKADKLSPQVIDAEIKQIQDAVRDLRRLKIIVSVVIAGAGVAAILAALAVTVGSVLLLRYRKNMINELRVITDNIDDQLEKIPKISKDLEDFVKQTLKIEELTSHSKVQFWIKRIVEKEQYIKQIRSRSMPPGYGNDQWAEQLKNWTFTHKLEQIRATNLLRDDLK